MKHLKSIVARLAQSRSAILTGYNKAAAACFTLAVFSNDALAQASTRGTLVNVFNWLYGLVGVIGGITLLVQIVNAKAGNILGTQDPRKQILNTLLFTALAFGVVALIQAVKAWAGGSGDISSI